MRYSARFWVLVCLLAILLLILPWKPVAAAGDQVVLNRGRRCGMGAEFPAPDRSISCR